MPVRVSDWLCLTRAALFSRMFSFYLDQVSTIPNVDSVAFTAYLPLSRLDNSWAFQIEGGPPKPVDAVEKLSWYAMR